MYIGDDNYGEGNEAMAWVLLLYYQIAQGNGISNDETVYLAQDRFDGFRFLDVKVDEKYEVDIEENLIRQGAIIYLICDLNDMISEHDDSYLSQDITKKILRAFKAGKLNAIPETRELFEIINVPEHEMDYEKYHQIRERIYEKYVLGTFRKLTITQSP